MTPSKIIQEVCITLKEIRSELNKSELIIKEGKYSQKPDTVSSSSEPSSTAKDVDILSKFMTPTLHIKGEIF